MATINPTEYETRIVALEKQCAVLAAQVDRQGKVLDAALEWEHHGGSLLLQRLGQTVVAYRRTMTQLARGGE